MIDKMPSPIPIVTQVKKEQGHDFRLDRNALKKVLQDPRVANMKVCVISIAGNARTGKSFLLNFLLHYLGHLASGTKPSENWVRELAGGGVHNGFSWRGGVKTDTSGILIWSEPFILRDFEGEEVAVILMDTEGIFDTTSTVANCATIFALSSLVSSINIYNVSQMVREIDLQSIRTFTEYGRMAVDQGGDAPFQAMMFLVRDWYNVLDYDYGIAGGEEYMMEFLGLGKGRQHPELQLVREYFGKVFTNIECFLMPSPGQEVAMGLPQGITEEFAVQLRVLVSHIRESIAPRRIDGRPITCSELCHYFDAYISAFQGVDMSQPMSMFDAMVEANNLSAAAAAKSHYYQEMEKLCGGGMLYVNPEVLNTKHKELRGESVRKFESVKKMGGSELSAKYLHSLEGEIEEAYFNFGRSNSAKNLTQSMQTPIVLAIASLMMFCLKGLFYSVGLDDVAGLFSAPFYLAIIVLFIWIYIHCIGKYRGVGKRIDQAVGQLLALSGLW